MSTTSSPPSARSRRRAAPLPSERDLAEQLNVKRHQLRKALEAMRRAGDLKPARTRRAPTAWPRYGEELVRVTNPIEVLELRLLIEPGLARLASLRASSFETARILEAATTPENAPSGEVDFAFHLAIAAAARNHLAAEIYRMLRQVGVDARVKVARTASADLSEAHRAARRRASAGRRGDFAARSGGGGSRHARPSPAVQKQIIERSNAGAFAA